MMKTNGLRTGIIIVLLGVLAAAILSASTLAVVRMNNKVNDHETRLSVVEVVMGRIDKNVQTILEKP